MKNIFIISFFMFLTGCIHLNSSPSSKFYTLRVLENPQKTFLTSNINVCLGDIQTPLYLDKTQIITRSPNEIEIFMAEFERWSEPFPNILRRTVYENLSKLLPNASVSKTYLQQEICDYSVLLDISRFDGVMGNNCTLNVWVRILNKNNKTVLQKKFEKKVNVENTYPAYIKGIEDLVNFISLELAQEIQKLSFSSRTKS